MQNLEKQDQSKHPLNREVHPHISKAVLALLIMVGIGGTALTVSSLSQNQDNRSRAAELAPTKSPGFAPDQVLLKFRQNVTQDVQNKALSEVGAKVKSEIPQIQTKVISVNPNALDAVIEALSHNPAVEFAEKDWVKDPTAIVPNDPYYNGSADANNYQWPFTVTRTNDAWDKTTGSGSVIVAVLDTGIDLNQPDLGTLVPGWNVVNNNSDVTYTHPHGVYTSGVVNAHSNNGIGVASTCWQCSVMMVKVSMLSSGSAYSSDLAKGITYATDHGAKIISMSYAGTSSDATERSAEQYALNKGLLIFGAAGNSGCDCPTYPAADPGVIGVTDVGGASGDFINENYGSWVKIAAPSGVATTWPSNGSILYAPVGGTSISTPFAAGVAGLLWSAQPQATSNQIRDAIFNTADQFADRFHPERATQYGRINSYNAMVALTGSFSVTPPDTTKPTVTVSSPTSNSTVTGQTTINVSASDNAGVTKVSARAYAYINGAIQQWSFGMDTSAPYSFNWDTTAYPDSTNYHVCARAYDTSLNESAESCNSSITIANGTSPTPSSNPTPTAAPTIAPTNTPIPPTPTPVSTDTTSPSVTIVSPSNGAIVARGKNINITANATDNVGITKVEFYINGTLKCTDTTAFYACSWNVPSSNNKTYTIKAIAYDAAGNTAQASVNVKSN